MAKYTTIDRKKYSALLRKYKKSVTKATYDAVYSQIPKIFSKYGRFDDTGINGNLVDYQTEYHWDECDIGRISVVGNKSDNLLSLCLEINEMVKQNGNGVMAVEINVGMWYITLDGNDDLWKYESVI
jgi:hypothetical protein